MFGTDRAESVAGTTMGALGWIIDPDGAVLARTTDAEPVAIRDIELTEARVAKRTYPRYVARD